MLVHKSFRYRIYPTPQQEKRLREWQHTMRFLWNLAHEQRLMCLARVRDHRRYPTVIGQQKEMTALRAELPWLADVPYDVCAQLLVELDRAWQRCFSGLSRAPRWKSKTRDSLSLCESSVRKWRLTGSMLRFPKIGNVRVAHHRTIEGRPVLCSLKRDAVGDWFASIVCAVDLPDPAPRHDPVVAIDRGVTNMVADSDGRLVPSPRFHAHAMRRLARAQRIVSRRKKGSKNREKAQLRVARLHRKVRRQREHVVHGLSATYAKSHGTVVIEKLNTSGMVRGNRGTARAILDSGWGRLAECLRYKLAWSGGRLIEVPAAYSSQTCSACGVVDAKSRRGERFCCTGCGHVDHADLNAAKVLKSRANRSALPVEGTVPETARRSRKVTLRSARTGQRPANSLPITVDALGVSAGRA